MNCFKCGNKAVGRLSPDLDIKGVGYCKEHKELALATYIELINKKKEMTTEELLKKINSVKLCLMAHPDNEEDSEFADRISDLEEIKEYLIKQDEKN